MEIKKIGLVLWSLKGNTGKTQLIALLTKLLGIENTVNLPIQYMNEGSKFRVGGIPGKRLICVGDQTSADIKDSSLFKQLTGGDFIETEKKGLNPWSCRYNGGLIFACNNLPYFCDDKGAHLFERLCIVPCDHTVPPDKRDPDLLPKMLKERDAIFGWFMAGLNRLIHNGWRLTCSQECSKAMEDYRRKTDTLYRYISESCEITSDSKDVISKAEFENGYLNWCDYNDYKSIPKRGIKDRMTSLGCPARQGRIDGKAGIMVYRGVRYRETQFQALEKDVYAQQSFPFK